MDFARLHLFREFRFWDLFDLIVVNEFGRR